MKPEEQRIAIAEWCGWTFPEEPDFELYWAIRPNGVEGSPGPVEKPVRFVPDYLNDLNTMHEAEMKLTDDDYTRFEDILWELMADPTLKTILRGSSATASQRAEALLRTIGKWTDSTVKGEVDK